MIKAIVCATVFSLAVPYVGHAQTPYDPTTGEEVETLTKEVMSQPPEVIERIKKMMGK